MNIGQGHGDTGREKSEIRTGAERRLFEGVLTLHLDLEGVMTVPWRTVMQSALGITWFSEK